MCLRIVLFEVDCFIIRKILMINDFMMVMCWVFVRFCVFDFVVVILLVQEVLGVNGIVFFGGFDR